jgi:hypothetical protein
MLRKSFYNLKTFPSRRPVVFGMGLSGFKTGGVDLFVQTQIETKELKDVDRKRFLFFTSFGFLYLGCVQYAIYVPLFRNIFPNMVSFSKKSLVDKVRDKQGMKQIAYQVSLDQFIHHPFLYFPTFYIVQQIVENEKIDNKTIKTGLGRYEENYQTDLFALWKIWIPATIINFTINPMWMRIPFTAMTSVLWTAMLSIMRGGDFVESTKRIKK